jgi:prepilin-type N-terminal cleavage/methylation domain-containing protein
MKKMNNKGFSLVELIVVIAIMAVLIGVLAPTLLGNIEKSKLSKDKDAIDVLFNAIQNTTGDPDYSVNTSGTLTISSDSDGVIDIDDIDYSSIINSTGGTLDADDFAADVKNYVGDDKIELTSKYYKNGYTITFAFNDYGKVKMSVKATHFDEDDDDYKKGSYDVNGGTTATGSSTSS